MLQLSLHAISTVQVPTSSIILMTLAGCPAPKKRLSSTLSNYRPHWMPLSLVEAKHKASPPSQQMTWLGMDFDLVQMSITICPSKLAEITILFSGWKTWSHADLHSLRVLLGKLLNVTQCCPLARYFLNHMLDTTRACPSIGLIHFTWGFQKGLELVCTLPA